MHVCGSQQHLSATVYCSMHSQMYQSGLVGCSYSAKGSVNANAHSACKCDFEVDDDAG